MLESRKQERTLTKHVSTWQKKAKAFLHRNRQSGFINLHDILLFCNAVDIEYQDNSKQNGAQERPNRERHLFAT